MHAYSLTHDILYYISESTQREYTRMHAWAHDAETGSASGAVTPHTARVHDLYSSA